MELVIRRPDDFHVHLREPGMLQEVLPHTLRTFSRALVMPNLRKPVQTAEDAIQYRSMIYKNIHRSWGNCFQPLMTIYLTRKTTPAMVREAKDSGVLAIKCYPPSLTTNSELGVQDPREMHDVLSEMERIGMVFCIHPECETLDVLNQELAYVPIIEYLAHTYPDLSIVVEHVTTVKMLRAIRKLGLRVAATITVHHLLLTLNDVIKGKIRPHNYCAPIAKMMADRTALLRAAMSGNPKFFLGTDSAPHLVQNKQCIEGCAGIFTAPVAMEVLLELFEQHHKLHRLQGFTSEFGAAFYGLTTNTGFATYIRKPWSVPNDYSGIRPFMAGRELQWQLKRV